MCPYKGKFICTFKIWNASPCKVIIIIIINIVQQLWRIQSDILQFSNALPLQTKLEALLCIKLTPGKTRTSLWKKQTNKQTKKHLLLVLWRGRHKVITDVGRLWTEYMILEFNTFFEFMPVVWEIPRQLKTTENYAKFSSYKVVPTVGNN